MLRRHVLQAGVSFALLAISGIAAAKPCGSAPLESAELALLEVTVGETAAMRLSELVPALDAVDGIYLPLQALSEALEFPIEVNDSLLQADGWFLSPERSFSLDLEQCQLEVANRRGTIDPHRVRAIDQDIHVHVSLLEEWFPLVLSVDRASMRLNVSADEPLPVEKRLERQSRWQRYGNVTHATDDSVAAYDTPYRFMDWPFVDVGADFQRRELANGDELRNDRYKLVAAGDLFWMNAQVAATSTNGETQDVFATLARRDPYADMLGPLHATELALGDIGMSRDPLIGNNVLGRGIRLSNRPLGLPDAFDRINLQGELPLGWDVELYRNGQLLAFQSGAVSARYDFQDVPLDFGVNNFRLVFYGPNGQVREETVQRIIGQEMIRPGEFQYSVTGMERRLLRGQPDAYREAFPRIAVSVDQGLSSALSIGAAWRQLPLDDARQDYRSGHVNLGVPGLFARLEHVQQVEGGKAFNTLLSTRLLNLDIGAEISQFENFDSERVRSESVPGQLEARHAVRVNSTLPRFAGMGLTMGLEARRTVGTEGERLEGLARLSLNNRYGTFTHMLEMDRTDSGSVATERARQHFLFSTRRGPLALRGEVVEELRPARYVRSIGAYADWMVGDGAGVRLGATRLPMEQINTYSAGLNWRFDEFSLGFNVASDDLGETSAGLTISGSFLRDPGRRDWQLKSGTHTHVGALAADVFLDNNGNGQRDAGEPPVPDVRVQTRTGLDAASDATGYAFIAGLRPHEPLAIGIDEATIENPFWKVSTDPFVVVPRPGRTARLQIPVTPTGSVEGKVVSGTDASPLPGEPVQLLTLDGEPVAETWSAYDGYYHFDGIPPGYYRLRNARRPLDRRQDPRDLLVSINGELDVTESVDLVVGYLPGTVDGREADARTAGGPVLPASGDSEKPIQDRGVHVIQLMAASRESAVVDYIVRHGLAGSAHYVRTVRRGADWFQVLTGRYPTAEEARAAIAALPAALGQAGPYIRPLAGISGAIHTVGNHSPDSVEDVLARGEAWLRSRDSGRFTIQLAALATAESAHAFVATHRIANQARVVRTHRDRKVWYVVLHGDHPSRDAAQNAVNDLPAALRSDCWIRLFRDVRGTR